MLIDTHMGTLEALEDSHNQSQVMETLLHVSPTSINWELTFLDSDPGLNHLSHNKAVGGSTLK